MEKQNAWLRWVGYVILAAFILGAAFLGYERYMQWRGEQKVEALKQALEKWVAEENKEVLDGYGGKTPQETLSMYIAAVEKGDYELASKYFIYKNQDKELNSLKNSPKENIKTVILDLKQSVYREENYSPDKKEYVIDEPLFVDLKLQSDGIWKIVKI